MAGLIPAYAGRTWLCASVEVYPWAHPRLRGADSSSHPARVRRVGSSPLTRGGLERKAEDLKAERLIPAYAGRTTRLLNIAKTFWAHPRLRGADMDSKDLLARCFGSSPLTRGGLK